MTVSTLEVLAVAASVPEPGGFGDDAFAAGRLLPVEEFCVVVRCRSLGAGKLDFLSIASTVRWKRRKSASARMSVDSKSMVVDSSLTLSSR